MIQWLNKMERKFGKYAIPDLTRYVVGAYCLGALLEMLTNFGIIPFDIYYNWLCLDMSKVAHGQVWRLFTYLLEPYGFSGSTSFVLSVLFLVIQVNLFFLFGRSLERAWGTFRFNMYFFSGYLLNIIAALSEGAMRDALSILERCIQDGENNIDENKIKELVGIPKLQYIHCITQAIVEYNIDEAMETITKVLNEGKDLNNLLWEIIKYVKDILMVKTNQKLTIYNDEDFTRLQELSEKITKERAIRLISELSELENNMKQSTQRQIVFEAGIIKLCDKEISNAPVGGDSRGNGDIYARLDKIENYLRSSGGTTRARAPQTNRTTNQTQNQSKSTTDAIAGIGKNSKPAQYWKDIVNNLKQNGKIVLYTNLINTNAVEVNDMTIGIQFPGGITPFGKAVLEKPENKQELIKQVSVACGKEMNIKFIDTKPQVQEASEEQEISNFANGFDIPFDVVE